MNNTNNYLKDLKEFKEFLKDYKFKQLEIIENEDKTLYCEGELLKDNNGYIGESSKWINAGYTLSGTFPKLLSNLFHYEFEYMLNALREFLNK